MRVHLLLLFLALPACAETGTGGYAPPPEAAAYLANGTATAAAISVTSTAVAVQSTQSANIAIATQQAQATAYQSTAVAQATSAQGTAVAAMTATEQHQLDSAAAIAMMTSDAIAADVMRMQATATAVAMQAVMTRQAADEMLHQERARNSAEFWYWFKWAVLAFIAFTLWQFIPKLARRLLPEDTAVEDGNGHIIAVRRDYHLLAIPPAPILIEQPAAPEPAPGNRAYLITVDGGNGMGTVEIATPEPGNFRRWLTAVLDEASRVQFSQNEAHGRGWDDKLFFDMVHALKKIGWMMGKPDGNGVYRLSDAGRARAREWLGLRPYSNHSPTANDNGRQTAIEGELV